MSRTYDCPNCSAPVTFQSSVAVFVVCAHCRSMVVRHDVNVEKIGVMAELLPDVSPLQIGTRGEFEGQPFTLLGRVRLAYDEGSWNEWFASFGDGRFGWIGQAQGFFMASFEITAAADFKSNQLPPGKVIEIEDEPFRVVDRKHTTCLGGEGELPFVAESGRQATSIDLTGVQNRFASIEISTAGTRMFVGSYARFDDLKFTNLRSVPGWSDELVEPIRNKTSAMNCRQCGAEITLLAAGFSMSATCQRCGTLLDTATPELQIIRRAQEKRRIEPIIPLGRRGMMFGVNYEVIGFQHVEDGYGGWNEYLLFNPWQGFNWLVTYRGHWSFVRRLFEQPTLDGGSISEPADKAVYAGEKYRLFAKSNVTTTYVLGEFYWKVSLGAAAQLEDFIRPPLILSRETYPRLSEQTWSQGEYVAPEIVQQAFGLEEMQEPIGIYLNQANPHAERMGQLKWIVPVIAVLLVLIQFFSIKRAANEKVLEATYVHRAGVTNPAVMTQPFEIKGKQQPVEFIMHAPVDNNWIELGVDLINADTKQVVAVFEEGIERYHGYDDGYWSEGSQSGRRLISAVPPGKYYLLIDSAADPAIFEMPFQIRVVRDVPLWANFWIALGLLLAYPIYRALRAHAFERARWAESDYSPYASFESDDD